MSNSISTMLAKKLTDRFSKTCSVNIAFNEVTMEVPAKDIVSVCKALHDEADFEFQELVDLCGVDYLAFGDVEWETIEATGQGFSRGVTRMLDGTPPPGKTGKNATSHRFAVVYHLLSITKNLRLRLKAYLPNTEPVIDTVVNVWSSANWYEREAFDLYGILFKSHPDLRRLLTDYGFVGHPFRKDFPLVGNVEMRYDNEKQRVVYEPVSIESRTLVPKVKRNDHRYLHVETEGEE